MLTPMPYHPVPFIRHLANKAAAEHPEQTESSGTRLGLLASVGFIGLILYLFAGLAGWSFNLDDGTVRACAVLVSAALLWCTVGGFGSVFNTFVTPLVRGYDRIIVFIVFFILASYGTVTTAFLSRNSWARTNPKAIALITLLMTVISFMDALWFVAQTREMREQAYAERDLVSKVERILGGKGMIFQIPYTPEASHSGPGRIYSFDHARPYIQSARLQWSWGTMNGTEQAHWEQGISQLPPEGMIEELVEKGFRGLWIDTYGYDDPATMPARQITALLGRQPLASSDGRYLFFDLSGIQIPSPPSLLET
jgi:hypothetical protein